MREDLVPAAEAREILLAGAEPLGTETVALANAAGRVLGQDLPAKRTQPPFPASAMDGYAVRVQDVAQVPARLKIIGTSAAGHPFDGTVGSGEAVRIFTGGVVPAGVDAVVIQENTTTTDDFVEILARTEPGQYIRPAGLDFQMGDVLLKAGDVLNPQRLSLAASMNYPHLAVYRKPVIALIATGDELVQPGETLADGQIIASNTFGLAALILEAGGDVNDMGIVKDSKEALRKSFRKALDEGADIIVTSGGASVGDHDLVMPVLKEMGAQFHFAKIAMKPGKPLLSGSITHEGRKVWLVGLAGNPVSSIIAGYIFLRPLVGTLAGRPCAHILPVACILGCGLPPNGEREDYQRAKARRMDNGQLEVVPDRRQDSSMLAALVRADALLIRKANAPAASKGDPALAVILREPA